MSRRRPALFELTIEAEQLTIPLVQPILKFVSWALVAALLLSGLPEAIAETNAVVTVDELRRMYPDAEFREVTLPEFDAATSNPATRTVIVVEPPAGTDAVPAFTGRVGSVSEPVVAPAGSWRRGRPPRTRYDHERPDVVYGGDVYCVEAFGSFDVDSREVAVVLFVVVGVVVVAAALVYTGLFVYDALTREGDFDGWLDTGAGAWFFYGGERGGGMYGARIAGGFMGESADVGLMLEAGYIHGDVAIREDNTPVSVSASYGIVGPTIRWVLDDGRNPFTFDMEVLAGVTSDDNLGLISRASAGFSWGIGPSWRMGLAVGSLYMKIRETEGPLRTKSDFNMAIGVNAGRAF